jgi:hypothetical protein
MITITVAGLIAPPNDIGAAEGFLASTRSVAGTIAASIYICVYTDRLNTFLPQEIVPAVEKAGLPATSLPALFAAMTNGTTAALEAVPGMKMSILAAFSAATRAAYTHAFKIVYLSSIAFASLAFIGCIFVTDVDKYMTDFVNKTIHKPNMGRTTE